MSVLNITRPPQYTDPWFAEIEQVWDELELANNDIETRVTALETTIANDVVTSISKSGDPQLKGDVTLTQNGTIVITQVGNNIEIGGGGYTDHGALTGLLDDDHTQYLLASGLRSLSGNWSIGNYELLNVRMENVATDPAAGNQGRLVFNTTDLQLRVDTGAAFVNVGVTDHGLLSGLGDDDHTQYLLVDGSRDCTGDFTVQGKYKGPLNGSMIFESQDDDTPTPIAFIMDTATLLTDPSAKLLSVRNQGVEKFYIDKDGNIAVSQLSSTGSAFALIDTDNNSTTEVFSVKTDSPTAGSATELFSVEESGNAWLLGNLRVGAIGIPTNTLDVDGTANISGDVEFGGLLTSLTNLVLQLDTDNDETAQFEVREGTGNTVFSIDETGDAKILTKLYVGGLTSATNAFGVNGDSDFNGLITVAGAQPRIRSATNLEFQVDYDADGTNAFNWLNGSDVSVMTLDESGNLVITGTLTGGSSPFIFYSKEVDGASAVAYVLDTQNALSTLGAKLFSLKNNGTEVFAIDKDGIIVVGGGLTSTTSVSAFIDSDNDSTTETFTVYHNCAVVTPGNELFQVRENGEVEIYGSPLILNDSGTFEPYIKALDGQVLHLKTSDDFAYPAGSQDMHISMYPTTIGAGTAGMIHLQTTKTGATRKAALSLQDFAGAGGQQYAAGMLVFGTAVTSRSDITLAENASGMSWTAQASDLAGANANRLTMTNYSQTALGLTNIRQVFRTANSDSFGITADGKLAVSTGIFKSNVADGASAIAYTLDTVNSLANSAAKLLSVQNQTVEKAYLNKAGGFWIADQLWVNGTDASSGGGIIKVGNGGQTGQGIWFDVNDSVVGAALIDAGDYARIRMESTPSTAKVQISPRLTMGSSDILFEVLNNSGSVNLLNVAGNGDLTIAGTLIGGSSPFKMKSKAANTAGVYATNTITVINNSLDTNDLVRVYDHAGLFWDAVYPTDYAVGVDTTATAANIAAALNTKYGSTIATSLGNVITITATVVGTQGNLWRLYEQDGATNNFTLGGSSPFYFTGGVEAAVAYELDTQNDITQTGSKLLSIKRNGVEKFYIDKDGIPSGGSGFVVVVKPEEGGAGIQTALTAAKNAGGGIVQLLKGTYSFSTGLTLTGANNVTLRGVGEGTVLAYNGVDNMYLLTFSANTVASASDININTPAMGASTIVTTNPLHASPFVAGLDIIIYGDGPDGNREACYAKIKTSGDGGGNIVLDSEISVTFSANVKITASQHGHNMAVEDLRITDTLFDTHATIGAIHFRGLKDSRLSRVTIDSVQHAGRIHAIWYTDFGYNVTVEDCKFSNILDAFYVYEMVRATVKNNTFRHCRLVDNYYAAAFACSQYMYDSEITGNRIDHTGGSGMAISYARRTTISHNIINNAYSYGINVAGSESVQLIHNTLTNVAFAPNSGGLAFGTSHHCIMSHNIINNASFIAVYVPNGAPYCVVDGNVCEGGGSYGGYSCDADYSVVTNNIMRNCSATGYAFYVSRQNSVATGNIVIDPQGTGMYLQMINGSAVGNTCRRTSGTSGIIAGGTDSVYVGNVCSGTAIFSEGGTGNDYIGNKGY